MQTQNYAVYKHKTMQYTNKTMQYTNTKPYKHKTMQYTRDERL